MYICTNIYNVHVFTVVKVLLLLLLSKCVLEYTVMFCSYIFLNILYFFLWRCDHYSRSHRKSSITAESFYGSVWLMLSMCVDVWSSHSTWRLILAHDCPPNPQPTLADCRQGIPRRVFAAHSLGCWRIRGVQYLPCKAGVKTPTHTSTRFSLLPYIILKNLLCIFFNILKLYINMNNFFLTNNEKQEHTVHRGRDSHTLQYLCTVLEYISYDLTVHIQQSHQHPISSPLQLWLACCDYEGLGSSTFIPEREGRRDRKRIDGNGGEGSHNVGLSETRVACFPSII